jgi:hypothetical protein
MTPASVEGHRLYAVLRRRNLLLGLEHRLRARGHDGLAEQVARLVDKQTRLARRRSDLTGPERSEGPYVAPQTQPLHVAPAAASDRAEERETRTPDTHPANHHFSASGEGAEGSSEGPLQRAAARYGGDRTA